MSLFGPFHTSADLRDGLEAHLKLWQPTYLAFAERETGRDPETLPLIRGWEKPNELRKWPETQLPACIIIVQGSTDPPAMQGDGTYSVTLLTELILVCSAKNEQASRDLVSTYASAFAAAVLQNPSLGGIAQSVQWRAMGTNRLPDSDAGRTVAAEGNSFAIEVEGVLSAHAGLTEPPDDPYDVPEFPTIDETQVEVLKT